MKKLALTCCMLLALVAFSTPDAEAQFCFKWVVFCDGIQVNDITNNQITSDWYHIDCASTVPMDSGSKGETPVSNACPGGTGAGLIQGNAFGNPFHFVIDAPLTGTLDMVNGVYPSGSCWIDELQYSLLMGPCVGLKNGGERQQMRNRSSAQ
jgi:hypothetical protein